MVNTQAQLKDRAVKRAVNNLRKDKRVEAINLALIADELDVTLETLKNYYSSEEDIFLKAQKKDWDSLHRYWDKRIEKAKTPGDYKYAFELFFEPHGRKPCFPTHFVAIQLLVRFFHDTMVPAVLVLMWTH